MNSERIPDLTTRQGYVLLRLTQWIDVEGYAPTIRQLAVVLKVRPSTVHDHLVALERHGAIAREPGAARAVRVLWRPRALAG